MFLRLSSQPTNALLKSLGNSSHVLVTGPVHGVTCRMHCALTQDVYYLVFEHYRLFALLAFEF